MKTTFPTFLVGLVAFLSLIIPSYLLAQDTQDPFLLLKGKLKEEVVALLGSPDQEKINSASSTTLYYGTSQILLISNSVRSVYDAGELTEKIKLANTVPEDSEQIMEWTAWINPWTPSDKEVSIHSILEEAERLQITE